MKKIKLFLIGAICLLSTALNAQNGLHFDGSNDYVQTTYSGVFGAANRTFEAWIYVDASAPASNLTITDYGLNASGSRNTFVVRGNRGISYLSGGTNGNIGSTASGLILDNQWTHVAFVLNNGTGFLYVNGSQVGTGNLSGVNTPSGNANLTIGQRVSGGSIPFHGKIDEVRVWNYARTGAEITADMNNEFTCGIPTGLVVNHKFNQGTAGGANTGLTTSTDELGNNGTLTNFALTGATSNWVTGQTLTATPVPANGSQILVECNGFTTTINGNTYSTTGIYTDTLVGAAVGGCDSVLTTDLTVGFDNSTNINGSVITANENGATYQWLDCNNNNAYITGETNQTYIPTASGSYAVEITNGTGCIDTSACENLTGAVILNNNALHFDGVDDKVVIADNASLDLSTVTLEAWINLDVLGINGSDAVIIDKSKSDQTGYAIRAGNGALSFYLGYTGAWAVVNSPANAVTTGTWHHVAGTYDGTNLYLYIDGVLVGTNSYTGSISSNNSDLWIGASPRSAGVEITGKIDEARVWNHARTQAEIIASMNNEFACGTPTGLVSYHKFNHGTAAGTNTGLTNSTCELGNDGTLNNFALTGATSNWVTGQTLIEKRVPIAGSQILIECNGFTTTINGNTYSTTGIYTDTLVGAGVTGCDSVLTTDLTVGFDNSTTIAGATITANQLGATYQWMDCNNNNAYITGETAQSFTATTSGTYAVEITFNGCADTSACENVASAVSFATNGIHFNDAGEKVTTTGFLGITGSNPRTVEAWINVPVTAVSLDGGITTWGVNGSGTKWVFRIQSTNGANGTLRCEVNGGAIVGTTDLRDGLNHHVAVTWENDGTPEVTDAKLYVDGVLETISFQINSVVLNTSPDPVGMVIGSNSTWAAGISFLGMIDEVRVWDYARTQAEIAADMNTEFCNAPSGLVSYHKFNHGIANGSNPTETTSNDDSGLGFDGTLTGFALTGTNSNWIDGSSMNAINSIQALDECDGFSVIIGGNTYNTTGVYQDTLTGASFGSCDSVITTFLTIASVIDITTNTVGQVITANTTGASYQWIDCNNANAYIVGETGQSYTASTNGDYAVEITEGNCTDTSACASIIGVGINDIDFNSNTSLYPNPTKGIVTIKVQNIVGSVKINVIEITGKSVLKIDSNKNNTVLDLNHLKNGIYFIQITSNNSSKTIKLLKL